MRKKGIDIFWDDYAKKYDVVYYTIEQIRKTYKSEYVINSEPVGGVVVSFEGRPPQMERPRPLQCFLWVASGALFSFFVWCVSVECYKHGYNIFKSVDSELEGCVCDMQRFRYFFPVGFDIVDFRKGEKTRNKETDRKTLQNIKQGYRPKGADKLEKIVSETLQKFFI